MTQSQTAPKLPLHMRALLAAFSPLSRLLHRLGYRPLAERCSWCRKDLPAGAAFYIEGRRVCADCAERGRRRMLRAAWAYVILSILLMAFAGVGAVLTFRRGDPDAWIALPILVASGLFPLGCLWFVLRAMKASNRRADQTEQVVALFSAMESLDAHAPRHPNKE